MSLDVHIDFAAMFRNDDRAYAVDAGTVIFTEGEPGDCLYVILDGEVDIRVHDHHVWRLKAGEVFGEMALVEARPRSALAVAHTPCRLVPVDERRFLFLVSQTPYFALGLLRLLASRLRAMDETVS
ncbi:MAG: cyclic nucleotide-binding domain-containing protein [Gammaproteobacteria bacterium]